MSRVILRALIRHRSLYAVLVGLVWLLSPHSALAEPEQVRLALVIGNSIYANPDEALPGASVDSKTMVEALEKQNFKVRSEANLSRKQMMNAVQEFKENLAAAGTNSIGFLYYAGHGGSDRKHSDNFLIPVDAELKDIAISGLSVRWIQDELQQLRSSDNHPTAIIVVIDACRTLTQAVRVRETKQASGNRERPAILAMTNVSEPEEGYLFAFSTSKNQTASDSGQFAQELITHMSRKGLTIPGVFEEVQREVKRKTGQFPIYQNSITDRLCLVTCEPDTKGAFTQNELLLKETQKEAEASLKTIETLGAPNRCQPGWGTAVALYESAKKHQLAGAFDTAGETYRAVTERAVAIQAYLSVMNSITESTKKLEALREQSGSFDTMVEKSNYESPYRSLFKDVLGRLATAERLTGRRIDWSQLRQIDAQMEAFANSGNYLDATERAIEGYNLGLATEERVLGQQKGTRIPKETRMQGLKMYRESKQRNPAMGMELSMFNMENTPAARACK